MTNLTKYLLKYNKILLYFKNILVYFLYLKMFHYKIEKNKKTKGLAKSKVYLG